MEFNALTIAQFLGGIVEGDQTRTVNNVAKIEAACQNDLVFLSNPKYEEWLYKTNAGIAIVNKSLELKHEVKATLIRVDDAYAAFAKLLELYVSSIPKRVGVSKMCSVHEGAKVGKDIYIGDFTVVENGAVVGDGCQIYPQVYIGENVKIGNNCKIYAGVKIYNDCVLGDNVILQSGCVIGGDGFGFAPTEDGSFKKIPQIGNVVLKNNVEIGANTCIDRATMGSTVIEEGVKLDNLIQIGHNVVIGDNTVMAAQCGIAGSTKIGKNVMMGGQVGVVGHLNIADHVKIGSQSGVSNNVEKQGEVLLGSPAMNGLQNHRVQAILKNLPDMRRQLNELSKKING